jgi:DNA segregation ATPase FtsK/SpoIIIE-like protein
MGNDLYLSLAQRRVFWRLRSLYHAAWFSLSRRSFAVRYGLRQKGASAHTFLNLARVTLPQLTLGLIVSATLQLVDPYLAHFYPFDRWNIPDSEEYVTYLATIAGMGGVFIGLYYAAVSAVGIAIYSRVPNDVRELLAREQVGNVYMSYLSFLTFSALSVAGFRVFGLTRIHLAVPVFTLLAGVGVVAFVKLGQRAFYLFDPTRLSHGIFRDLQGWVKQVEAGAYRWDDPSFQNHALEQASSALQTLNTLADISEKEPHLRARPFAELATSVLLFLTNYRRAKQTIPSQSRWYARKYVHRDWYRTDDTTVSIHHQTGTALVKS